ncbi:MAG: hypothetical protein ABIJ97_08655 [Bacteroidota bacterium]
MDYQWYEIFDQSDSVRLMQGDLVFNCPVVKPPSNYKNGGTPEIEIDEYNVVVMTQSCDLDNDKVNIVLVCPFYSWSEFINNADDSVKSKKGQPKLWEDLKKGALPAYHLLMVDKDSILKEPIVVVFKDIFGIHISSIKLHLKNSKNCLRLLPPYREHLSQAFARYFMRVGLPQNIPSFSEQFSKNN